MAILLSAIIGMAGLTPIKAEAETIFDSGPAAADDTIISGDTITPDDIITPDDNTISGNTAKPDDTAKPEDTATPEVTATSDNIPIESGKKAGPLQCPHEYKWDYAVYPTAVTGGLMYYKCFHCGYIKTVMEVPPYTEFCANTAEEIQSVPANSIIEVNAGFWSSFKKNVIHALTERSDVGLVVSFQDKGVEHSCYIPPNGASLLKDADHYDFYDLSGIFHSTASAGLAQSNTNENLGKDHKHLYNWTYAGVDTSGGALGWVKLTCACGNAISGHVAFPSNAAVTEIPVEELLGLNNIRYEITPYEIIPDIHPNLEYNFIKLKLLKKYPTLI